MAERARPRQRVLRWVLIALVALIVGLPAIGWAAFQVANRTNGEILTSGETRRYLLHVPESIVPGEPVPLVVDLHGFAQWPANQRDISNWDDLADEEGFIVVHPEGTGFPLRWASHSPDAPQTDRDVTFIADLIDHLSGEYAVDPDRIHVAGISNGGGMAFVLSCELPGIASIGTVAGLFTYPWESCDRTRPVPLIAFHGLADEIVPFGGGPLDSSEDEAPDVASWMADLAARNGCTEQTALPAEGVLGGTRWSRCDAGADVVLHTIADGGHTWPGGDPLPAFIAGYTSPAIDATATMWEFFEDHPLPR
ncbi:MAG: alpha/beta hydrolase family esterase [Actinomycetota bacterium]